MDRLLLASALITAIAAVFIASPFVVMWLAKRHARRADKEWTAESRRER